MLGSVLAQLVRSLNGRKCLAAYFQMSPSALGSQFGSRARRYNISRARRSVKEVVVIFFIGKIFIILFQFYNLKTPTKLLSDHGLVIFYTLCTKNRIWTEKLVKNHRFSKICNFDKMNFVDSWPSLLAYYESLSLYLTRS